MISQGIKVICIDDCFVDSPTNPFRKCEINLPKKDEVYTVREVVKTSYGSGIRLYEIKNKKYYFSDISRFEEPTFSIKRFRQIEDDWAEQRISEALHKVNSKEMKEDVSSS